MEKMSLWLLQAWQSIPTQLQEFMGMQAHAHSKKNEALLLLKRNASSVQII
jgi:hypothetical protein